MLIIAMFLLVLSGCGYKANPYYEKNVIVEDKNIKFIIKNNDINKTITNEKCK